MPERPYVRVYSSLQRDHPRVWQTPALLGWYVRFLTSADGAYPEPAELPRAATDDVIAELVDEGIVELVGESAFTFHGLARERADRQRAGVAGGLARAESGARREDGTFAPSLERSLDDGAGDSLDDPSVNGAAVAGPVAGTSALAIAGPTSALEVAGAPATERAGRPAIQPSKPSQAKPSDDASSVVVARRTSTTPARAREAPDVVEPEAEEWFGDVRPAAPQTIDCDDYRAHQTRHVNIAGVGWRCPVCESARAEAGPSFSERMEAAGGSHF